MIEALSERTQNSLERKLWGEEKERNKISSSGVDCEKGDNNNLFLSKKCKQRVKFLHIIIVLFQKQHSFCFGKIISHF